jgi:hypothetical protein
VIVSPARSRQVHISKMPDDAKNEFPFYPVRNVFSLSLSVTFFFFGFSFLPAEPPASTLLPDGTGVNDPGRIHESGTGAGSNF